MPNQSDARKRILTFLGLAFSLSVFTMLLAAAIGTAWFLLARLRNQTRG